MLFRISFIWVCLTTCSLCHATDFFILGGANATTASGQHQATELRVANQDTAAASIGIRFLPASSAAAPDPYVASLAPGQMLSYQNVLREIWNLEDASGVLIVRADRAVQLWASRYSDAQEAQTAVDLPVLLDTDLVPAGKNGELPWLARSADFRGDVWVYLDSADSAANLILFDGAGKELARRALAGGPGAILVPVAELTADEVPLARARLEVNAGWAAAFGEISQTSANDSMGAPTVLASRLATAQVIAPALHLPAPGGGVLRTDLRLFNPLAQPQDVSLVFQNVRKTITLAPSETRETLDVLGSVFAITSDTSGTVFVGSPGALFALARTAVAPDWSSLSLTGEIHALEPTLALAGVSEPSSTAGIPSKTSAAWLVTRSSAVPSSADLVLRNNNGETILASANPVTLDPATTRLDPLPDVLGGSLPEGPLSLQLTPSSGLVSAAVLSLRPGGADPSFQSLQPPVPNSCPAPAIIQFRSLNAAGQITLQWSVDNAEAVEIAPGLSGLPPNGSRAVTVTSSTTFTLRATNSCGADQNTLTVAVGVPALTSLDRGSGPGASREGSPGQLLVLTFDALSDPDQLEFLVARSADGAERPITILTVTRNGTVYARVPFWLDLNAVRGYRTGPVQISGRLADGRRTGALPFTITPLAYAGDPVAGFRLILDSLAASIRESITQVRAAGLVSLADEQERAAAPIEASLRQLLADISTRGSGSLTYGSTNSANAVSVNMTRQDLAELLAFNENVAAAFAALEPVDPSLAGNRLAASSPRLARTCLAQTRPLVAACLLNKTKQRQEAAATDAVSDFFTDQEIPQSGQDAINAWVKKQVAKTSLSAALKKIQSWLTPLDVACLVHSVRLEHFIIEPKFVRHAERESEATPVKISAFLRPATKAKDIVAYLQKKEAESIANYLKLKGISRTLAETFIRAFVQASNFELEKQIAALVAAVGNIKDPDPVQVGNCDLLTVYPFLNGPGTSTNPNSGVVRGRSRLQFATSQPFGQDDYYLMGLAPGPETLCIIPGVEHFIFSDNIQVNARFQSKCPFPAGVNPKSASRAAGEAGLPPITFSELLDVGEGQPAAELVIENVEAGGDLSHANTFLPGSVNVSGGYSRSASDGLGSAKVQFRPTGATSWSLDIETSGLLQPIGGGTRSPHYGAARIAIQFRNPENRERTQSIRFTGSVEGNPACFLSIGMTAEGGRSAGGNNVVGSGSYSLDAPTATFGQISAAIESGVRNENESVGCKMKGTVELVR